MSNLKKIPFAQLIYASSISYPAPSNLNYFWNFGILCHVFFSDVKLLLDYF